MPNIKNLNMADAIFNNKNVEVEKTFFGLFSNVIYKATESRIDTQQLYLTTQEADKVKKILDAAPENFHSVVESIGTITPADYGNMRVDICLSRDHQFVALQLLQFKDFDYRPISDAKIYEEDKAEEIALLFAKK